MHFNHNIKGNFTSPSKLHFLSSLRQDTWSLASNGDESFIYISFPISIIPQQGVQDNIKMSAKSNSTSAISRVSYELTLALLHLYASNNIIFYSNFLFVSCYGPNECQSHSHSLAEVRYRPMLSHDMQSSNMPQMFFLCNYCLQSRWYICRIRFFVEKIEVFLHICSSLIEVIVLRFAGILPECLIVKKICISKDIILLI